MRKNEKVTVRSEGGKGVNCTVVDIDYNKNKIWVRLPTNQVIEMSHNIKQNKYVGYFARLEFTVNIDGQ